MALLKVHPEGRTAIKFAAVGCLGFLVDVAVLRLGLMLGAPALVARAISLTLAMHATFLVNGLVVFRCLERRTWLRQWASYLGTNGFGNLCNYLIFAGLVTSHWPVVSHRGVALVAGSVTAYVINYLFVRLLVFGKPREPCDAPRGERRGQPPQPSLS